VLGQGIAKLRRQTHAEKVGKFGAGRALRFDQRSFQNRGFCLLFDHKSSLAACLAESSFGAGFQRGML
jgi:hypothetical protein